MNTLNIDSLITTYSGMLETLKEIKRKDEDLKSLESIKSDLKKTKQECDNLKSKIRWNETHINILSHALGLKICQDCGGAGGYQGEEGDGGPCETCQQKGLLPFN